MTQRKQALANPKALKLLATGNGAS